MDSRYAINGIIANDDPIAEISLVGVTWNDLETSFKREVAFDPVYSTRKLFQNRKFVITTAPKHLRTHNAQIPFLPAWFTVGFLSDILEFRSDLFN